MNANIMNTQILLSKTSKAIEGHQKVKKGYCNKNTGFEL